MKVLYISYTQPNYSIDGVYINGLAQNKIEVFDYFFPDKGINRYKKTVQTYWEHRKKIDAIIIGFASPQAVILLKLISIKKIIYNALCSEYERMVVSRALAKPISVKGFYYWLQDFLASHLANVVMLESHSQIEYFRKLFKIPKKKCLLARLGVDDSKIFYESDVKKFDTFTVIFRGRLLPEAGAEYLVRAAKKLEDMPIKVIMIAGGMLYDQIHSLIKELDPKNFEIITEFLAEADLREMIGRSHLSIGQLSAHDRLKRTIPHKAYESLAMQVPYLTARNQGILELLTENETCLACNPADADDLANKIKWAFEHQDELHHIAQRAFNLYENGLTPKLLAQKVIERMK